MSENFEQEVKETKENFSEGLNEVTENKKLAAGLLGIFLGGFGIHKFYLGYTKEGVMQIIGTVVTCGMASIIGFIEGIIYLTKSDEEFYETYQVNKKPWF